MASPSKSHTRTPSTGTTTDAENPQSMVIASLRSQVGDLVSQVTQLNSKLVQSYDRISDLEDNIHIASSNIRSSTLQISQLELERTQHLSALNTGLLVEKSHVTSELNRLMERATEEAAHRGMAESARQEIEKDLDDLSAELFERANNMVAEARLAQAKSERRVQDTEAVLKGAEDAVASMQSQMQVLREQKNRTDRELNEMRELLGKGKWVERDRPVSVQPLRLLSTHAPYQEFLLFVAHLRQIRPGTPQLPPMATLLPLPFLARLVSEDSDPTLRLDAAPALNWLTRRAVSAAIHQSQLIVEPISASTLLDAQAAPGSAAAIAAFSSSQAAAPVPAAPTTTILCALCGTSVFSSTGSSNPLSPQPSSTASWRPAFLSRSTNSSTHAQFQSQPRIHSPTPSIATSTSFYPPSASSRLSPPPTPPPTQTQIYVFRVPGSGSGSPTLYPLCTSGWCLARLRSTCEVWRFVRRGVVEKVWAEEVPGVIESLQQRAQGRGRVKPPVPARRRMNVGKLIGMVVGKGSIAGNGSSVSGAGSGETETAGEEEKFSPPPVMGRRMSAGSRRVSATGTAPLVPPPLPRRSETRNVKVEAGGKDKEGGVDEIGLHTVTSIEGATLFDADHPKSDEQHPAHAHDPTKDNSIDDLLISPPTNSIDPSQIPLPPSPTSTSNQLANDAAQQPAQGTHITRPPLSAEADVRLAVDLTGREDVSTPPRDVPPPHSSSPAASPATSPAPPPLPRRAARRTVLGQGPNPAIDLDGSATPKLDAGRISVDDAPTPLSPVHSSPVSDTQPRPSSPSPDSHPPLEPQHRLREQSLLPPQDNEPYVGEATWEERTWKELVRLREDMFYARIGADRQTVPIHLGA